MNLSMIFNLHTIDLNDVLLIHLGIEELLFIKFL